MDDAQQSPSNEPTPAWPITRAEWDGLGSRAQKLHIMSWVFAGATALLGVALLCAPLLLTGLSEAPYGGTIMRACVVAGVVLLILAVFEYFWMRKGARSWDAYVAGEGAAAPSGATQPHWRAALSPAGAAAALSPGGRRERGLMEEARGAAALAGWFRENAAPPAPPPPLPPQAAPPRKKKREASPSQGGTHADAMLEHRTARRRAVGKLWEERVREPESST